MRSKRSIQGMVLLTAGILIVACGEAMNAPVKHGDDPAVDIALAGLWTSQTIVETPNGARLLPAGHGIGRVARAANGSLSLRVDQLTYDTSGGRALLSASAPSRSIVGGALGGAAMSAAHQADKATYLVNKYHDEKGNKYRVISVADADNASHKPPKTFILVVNGTVRSVNKPHYRRVNGSWVIDGGVRVVYDSTGKRILQSKTATSSSVGSARSRDYLGGARDAVANVTRHIVPAFSRLLLPAPLLAEDDSSIPCGSLLAKAVGLEAIALTAALTLATAESTCEGLGGGNPLVAAIACASLVVLEAAKDAAQGAADGAWVAYGLCLAAIPPKDPLRPPSLPPKPPTGGGDTCDTVDEGSYDDNGDWVPDYQDYCTQNEQ